MIEYCQVQGMYDNGVVIKAETESKIIAKGNKLIEVFNVLGKDGWKMCGQSLEHTYKGDTNRYEHFSIFYFMREIIENV